MVRLLGALVVVLALAVTLSQGRGQETKRGKIDVESMFKKYDTNNDLKLQKDEFLKIAEKFKDKGKAREKLTATFTTIDAEKKGFLSKEQFRSYFDGVRKKD